MQSTVEFPLTSFDFRLQEGGMLRLVYSDSTDPLPGEIILAVWKLTAEEKAKFLLYPNRELLGEAFLAFAKGQSEEEFIAGCKLPEPLLEGINRVYKLVRNPKVQALLRSPGVQDILGLEQRASA